MWQEGRDTFTMSMARLEWDEGRDKSMMLIGRLGVAE